MKRVVAVLRCILVAGFLVAVSAGPAMASGSATGATGSLGLRLLDVSGTPSSDPRAQVYIVHRLSPGAVLHRQVEVSNTTGSSMHVDLYAAAATIANGSFLGAAGHDANPLSTWTSVRPGILDLSPGGHANASVTIAVPRSAPSGEQYAAVWAEVRSTPSVDGGIVEVSRVGIRIYASVGPGGAPASNFVINSLTAERAADGQPIVLASVHNTGGRALDMSGTLRLSSGPGGLSAGPFPASLGTTLGIGDTEPVTVDLDSQLPAGPWDARITLRSGLISHSSRATITFPPAGARPLRFGTSHGSVERDIAIVVLIIVALGILPFTVRRRLRATV
jgi:hypothetical protein